MRLSQIWKIKRPTVSFEFFPARTPEGVTNLERVIDQLYYLEPDFVGSPSEPGAPPGKAPASWWTSSTMIRSWRLSPISPVWFAPDYIESILEDYQALGVENLLVVRGDPPHGQTGFVPHPQSFGHTSDLLSFIKPEFPFCLGVAVTRGSHRG